MDPVDIGEDGARREDHAVRFVDISGLENDHDSWSPVFLVCSGLGQAGVIEIERATRYYRFTPVSRGLSAPVPGSFSLEVLKRQVAEWLATRAGS